MKQIARTLAFAGVVVAATGAWAQQFPSKSSTVVIPFPPGASNDLFGRYLADGLSKLWKQPVVVENRPGAGGSIGASQVAKARPDGHTMMFSSSSFTINSAIQKDLPFDPKKDLMPVGMAMRGLMIGVTGSRIPLPTLAEVVKQSKQQKIFYGANGASTVTLTAELFNSVAGIKMEGVNYKGGTDSMLDIIGGRLDVYFGTVTTVLPAVLNKTATAVAIMSKTRAAALPNVPTVSEAGYPGAETDIWWGVFVPNGTPQDAIGKINESINTVMNTPEAVAFLTKQSALPARTTVPEFSGIVLGELDKWKDLAKKANISIN